MDLAVDAAALAARVLRSDPTLGPVRLLCVDGPAGAGKTTFTAALTEALEPMLGDVPVVHGDEVYEGWAVVAGASDRVAAFAALAERLTSWLLQPWQRAEPGSHPVWDWHSGGWGPDRVVPPAPVVVLEGVGLASVGLRSHAALAVWVDTPADRLARVLERDGDGLRGQMLEWQRDEQRWFERDGTRAGCSVRLIT